MTEALLAISQKGFGVVGVMDATQRLVGIITDGDLRRHMVGLLEHRAEEVMTKAPLTIGPDAFAQEAVASMNSRKVTCLFVVDPAGDGQASGLIHIHDCLRVGLG
jgi:arabinose-5-phosphate isomerase